MISFDLLFVRLCLCWKLLFLFVICQRETHEGSQLRAFLFTKGLSFHKAQSKGSACMYSLGQDTIDQV